MMEKKTQEIFFELLRAGLFPVQGPSTSEATKSSARFKVQGFESVDWNEVYRLAEEQSVIGLVFAGIEALNVELPLNLKLQFVGATLQIEQQNRAMNLFIEELVTRMRKAGIYTLIVKGQGVAQCYERPLWRSSGDIDFYMSDENFSKAKAFFRPLVTKFDPDNEFTQHINMHYGEWVVEIHANQKCSLSSYINSVLDKIHTDLFKSGNVRIWINGETQVFLPAPDCDVLLSFTHFLNHFYKGGLGVRQICDWSRLMWTYRDTLDIPLLESRIKRMGLMSEWQAFGAFAVHHLGMPSEAMSLYNDYEKWSRKAERIKDFVIEVGNFGHNRDMSSYAKNPFVVRKAVSMGVRVRDLVRHVRIFPLDSLRFMVGVIKAGFIAVRHGE